MRPDLEREIADLTTLLELTRDLAASVELMPLLQRIEAAALQVLDCERASLFLYDANREELYSKIATGLEGIRFSADRGISGEVVRTKRTINVPDAYADPRFNPAVDKQTGFRTRNMLTFPLLGHEGEIVGVLQVLNKKGGGFTEYDEKLASTLCAHAGVVIQRQLLIESFDEKRRLERDLDIARDIQRQLLPRESPQVDRYAVSGWSQPADQTGGDYYDFFPIHGRFLAMTVADASGHGIGPALVAAESRALLRAAARFDTGGLKSTAELEHRASEELSRLFTAVNDLLAADLPDERFVTTFFGVLSPEHDCLYYVSAGHAPILHYSALARKVRELPATGLPLGMMHGSEYALGEVIELTPGDALLVMTDGFFEWARPDGEMFGVERVNQVLEASAALGADAVIARLREAVFAFSEGTPQKDDLTVIAVCRVA